MSVTGESALHRAYELGRRALTEGLGILDVAELHHEALAAALSVRATPAQRAALVSRAQAFLSEVLSPFEMSHRAVGEANATLRRLNKVLEQDAKRIAHALHDEAGAMLAANHLAVAEAARDLPEAHGERWLAIRGLLNQTGEQLRRLSHELCPTILDDLGLQPALDFLSRGVAQRAGLEIALQGEWRRRMEPDVETAVYRAVQEALNNVARHARAKSVSVCLEHRSGCLYCAIKDDGIGFDVASVLARKGRHGLGLISMRERLGAVGGSLNIVGKPGRGTTVEMTVPLES